MDVGQAEASRSIGMSFDQTLRLIVLPQAIRSVIPPLASILIALTKNTAIAEAFGITEATYQLDSLVRDFPTALYPLFFGIAGGYVLIVFDDLRRRTGARAPAGGAPLRRSGVPLLGYAGKPAQRAPRRGTPFARLKELVR